MGTGIMQHAKVTLTVVIACYNEAKTLEACVKRVRDIADEDLALEIIIVDDHSIDGSVAIAMQLEAKYRDVLVLRHEHNRGKGAALRTGFQRATGDFVVVQDADLEYNPMDLKKLLEPLRNNEADVVIGSRFMSVGAHRVLYFWHSIGNHFLTFVSNMFSDLNLTDMECCYKVFRRDVIQAIELEEDRFGFEPEVVAKVAHMRLRIFEAGVSYSGRTYEEGKKIGAKDGLRAFYCILRYNLHQAPVPIQFLFYLFIGAIAAGVNLMVFLAMVTAGFTIVLAAPVAFVIASSVNYVLSILLLFRHNARWNSLLELASYILVVGFVGFLDLWVTRSLISWGTGPGLSKLTASALGLILNFLGRRFLVFPEPSSGSWNPERVSEHSTEGERTSLIDKEKVQS